jgi:hypothetical protein
MIGMLRSEMEAVDVDRTQSESRQESMYELGRERRHMPGSGPLQEQENGRKRSESQARQESMHATGRQERAQTKGSKHAHGLATECESEEIQSESESASKQTKGSNHALGHATESESEQIQYESESASKEGPVHGEGPGAGAQGLLEGSHWVRHMCL